MTNDLTTNGVGDVGDVSDESRAAALPSAAISGVLTGVVATALAFPTACDARLAPFMTDCRNVLGWASFADYPGTALMMGLLAGLAATLLVYLTMRFGDS